MLHSEELFRTLYDNLPGGMFIVGRDYTIKDVNKITCEITGYSGDVIAQRGVLDSDTNYLYKPFTVKSLTSKVREVFDS